MIDLPTALRDLADRIEAHQVQNGQAFRVEAKPGELTIFHTPDKDWGWAEGHEPLLSGWMEDGVWHEGASQVLDI